MTLHNCTVEADVRELGALVGEVLETQTSTDAFETVERLRTTAIDYRNDEINSRDDLDRTLHNHDPDTVITVARVHHFNHLEELRLVQPQSSIRENPAD